MVFRTYMCSQVPSPDLPQIPLPSRLTVRLFNECVANVPIVCENTTNRFGFMRARTQWNVVSDRAAQLQILGAGVQKLVGQAVALQALLNQTEKLDFVIDLGKICLLVRHTNPNAGKRNMAWWEPMLVSVNGVMRWSELIEVPNAVEVLTNAVNTLVDSEVTVRRAFGVSVTLRFDDFYRKLQGEMERIAAARSKILPFLPVAGSTHGMIFSENRQRVMVPGNPLLLSQF